MNNVYIYNDTFLSLLNLIDYLILHHIKPYQIKNSQYQSTLLNNVVHLAIEEKDIAGKIVREMGSYSLQQMYYVFLSNVEAKELILYYFYLNGLKYYKDIFKYRNLKCVDKVLKIAKLVQNECHKYKGFVRFKEFNNHVLYAEIEPSSDCLEILSIHFKRRLKNEYWIIKDVRRNLLSLYDKKEFHIVDGTTFSLDNILESREEEKIENLWKTFYQTIGIKERKNDTCRRNFMPKKYWKYMLEVKSEL